MRTSHALVLGAIGGATVAWLWGRELGAYVSERTRDVRGKAADGVRVVEEKTEQVLDRGGDTLRRADEVLRGAKEHVAGALRTAEETIRG
jgi:hypothetical protein